MILVPAAVLVLVILAAICVDAALVFLGQRQLAAAAEAAATDATSALSPTGFYQQGSVELDPATATAAALSSLDHQDLHGVTLSAPAQVDVIGRQVCVSLTGTVQDLLGRAIPGAAGTTTVRARATATAAGDLGPQVPHRALC